MLFQFGWELQLGWQLQRKFDFSSGHLKSQEKQAAQRNETTQTYSNTVSRSHHTAHWSLHQQSTETDTWPGKPSFQGWRAGKEGPGVASTLALCEENLAKNSHSCHLPCPLTLRSTHSHRRVPKQAQRSSKACSLKFKVLLLWYIHTERRHCYGNGQGQGSLAGGSTVLETLY